MMWWNILLRRAIAVATVAAIALILTALWLFWPDAALEPVPWGMTPLREGE